LGVEFYLPFYSPNSGVTLFSRFAPSSQFQSSIATGVRVKCKQKPKLSWVLHHAKAYFLSDVVFKSRVLLSLISDFVSQLVSDLRLCVSWDFDP
jgi:hypothetical protein